MPSQRMAGGRWPDFFIVGAPRCGTSFLYRFLRSHPGVFMPARKEPHHLSPDLDSGSDDEAGWRVRDREAYRRLFRGARPDQLIGEASTGYLASTVAPTAIRELAPNARILACVRDPVEQIASVHARRLVAGVEDLDLEAALDAEADRRAGRRLPPRPVFMPQAQYRSGARYLPQLERYVKVFGRERVHVLLLEDLARDEQATLAAMLRFLGLPAGGRAPRARVNLTERPRSSRLSAALYAPGLERRVERNVPAALCPGVRLALRAGRRLNRRTAERPALRPALRDRLRAEFRDDVDRLGAFLGRDLTGLWWGEPPERLPG